MKIFNGYVFNDENKSVPQYVWFRYGMTHLKYSSKRLGTTFRLQKGMNYEDTCSDTWRNKKMNGWTMSKTMY